jgi:pimeloyl-ACP methyl ester carboxylesterase
MSLANAMALSADTGTFDPVQTDQHRAQSDFVSGRVNLWRSEKHPDVALYIYVPHTLRRGRLPLVSVHGIARNAAEHAMRFASMAERYGVPVIAPLFNRKAYRMYQQFGVKNDGPRTDRVFKAVLDAVMETSLFPTRKMNLFGYSGGAQFAHRFMMANPAYVERLVIASAGWYTLPDETEAFPYGTKIGARLYDLKFAPKAYLRVPVLVLVGENDDQRDRILNTDTRVDAQQGWTRIARARSWVAAMNRQADEQYIARNVRLRLLPKATHSFTRNMKNNALDQEVLAFMYGPDPR